MQLMRLPQSLRWFKPTDWNLLQNPQTMIRRLTASKTYMDVFMVEGIFHMISLVTGSMAVFSYSKNKLLFIIDYFLQDCEVCQYRFAALAFSPEQFYNSRKTMLKSTINIILFFLIFSSCARTGTIGFKEHGLNSRPRHIVWFQFPGLASEHLALSKFSLSGAEQTTAIENHICLGNMWNFNLFKIRPSARDGFLSQMTGSLNIKGRCEDYKLTPVWNHFMDSGRISGMIESGISGGNSIISSKECYRQNRDFYKNIVIWRMDDELKEWAEPFHFQTLRKFEAGEVYYDQSCSVNKCDSDISRNIKTIWKRHFSDERKTLLIIRDFNYLDALKKKDVRTAEKILKELDGLYAYFSHLNQKNNNILVLISGSETRRFEFPQRGEEWIAFKKRGRKIIYRKSSLMSPVYAYGPQAENFCGIFPESQMFKRLSD